MTPNTETTITRDCPAVRIPSGEQFTLAEGTQVFITQALGGSYTVATDQGLARIADRDADALGIAPAPDATATPAAAGPAAPVEENAVWDQLRSCYDPEIPVNIVDLGLVYDCAVSQPAGQTAKVDVKMTLTAPGCGMGPVIAAEAQQKILSIPGVAEANVELVWDPPWNQAMISEVGKMKLGLL
jgi:probable FeS assembly SUF system protein SufT